MNASRPVTQVLAAITVAVLPSVAGSLTSSKLVAHEWGTFTSIQSPSGALLQWNGVELEELPSFVYNWDRPGLDRVAEGPFDPFSLLTTQAYTGLQRMELGRFAQPAIELVIRDSEDKSFAKAARNLLQTARTKDQPEKAQGSSGRSGRNRG